MFYRSLYFDIIRHDDGITSGNAKRNFPFRNVKHIEHAVLTENRARRAIIIIKYSVPGQATWCLRAGNFAGNSFALPFEHGDDK